MSDPFQKLHHLCIVVHDIERAVGFYESAGIGPWLPYPPLGDFTDLDMPDPAGFRALDYRYAWVGELQLQLCQPGPEPTPQRKFLDARGEGVFHIGFEVPDADAADETAAERGLDVLMRGRRTNGSGFTYYDTADQAGVILEIRQSPTGRGTAAMILVTGATGQIGGAALEHLAGGPGVRALAREPVDLGDVDVAVGTFDDGRSLAAALDGVETLFLTGRDNPDQVAQHSRVLDVARDAGVRYVVKLSAIGAHAGSPVALMRWHHAIEQQLQESRFAWTFLRPHLYMQNLLRSAGDVAEQSRIAAPMGNGRYPLVDTRDVAAAAAAVLRDPQPHAGMAYTLTGPAALGYADVARAVGDLIGRAVEYEARPPEDFRAGLVEAGIPEWRADDLAAIAAAYTDAENVPSPDLPELIGRPATPLDQFLSDHREHYLAGLSRTHL